MNAFGYVYFSRWLSGDANCAKVGMDGSEKLRRFKNNQNYVRMDWGLSLWMASVWCDALFKRLERIAWPS